jgi:hypothetical protein
MNELLQKLLEAEVLSEDTKTELETAFQTQLDEAIKAAEDNATADVRASLTEQWITERDQLIQGIDNKVTDFLQHEMTELKEDIESFRDLEAEYAEKLVEEKAAMSDELQNDLSELVEKMDAFLEIRLQAEMSELKEDLEEVGKNTFGRKIFEAFADEFMSNYSDDESNAVSLNEAQQRLADTEDALLESDTQLAKLQRKLKLDEVLEPLSGHPREVMAAILNNVDTEQLEEGYKTFIGRVLREAQDSDDDSEKEDKVLADEKDDDKKDDDKKDSDKKDSDKKDDEVKEGRVVTGDTEELLTESNDDPAAAQRIAYLQRIAGINN